MNKNNWEEIKLSDAIQFVIGGDWGKDPSLSENKEFVSVRCIRGAELRDWGEKKGNTAAERKIKSSSANKRRLIAGDIILEISGGGPDQPVGRTAYIDGEVLNNFPSETIICTNFFRLLRLSDELQKKFFEYYLKYFYNTGEVVKYQGGSNNLRNLRFNNYATIKIPLPPLNEQNRIVEKLDRLFARIDSIKESMEIIPELIKQFRQSVLHAAVTGKLTEEYRNKDPKWGKVRISEISTFIGSGITPKGGNNNYREEGIPFIRSQNVYPDGLRLDDIVYVSQELHNQMKRTHLKDKDVLLNITGASIGRSTFIPEFFGPGNVNQHVCIIRLKVDRIVPEFLVIYLNSPIAQREIMSTQVGMTRQALNYKQIRNIQVPQPRIDEQLDIIEKVNGLLASAKSIEGKYNTLYQKLSDLPSSLLSKAFEGELVPQNPNDEPAEKLLERILQEKAKLINKGRKLRSDNYLLVAEPSLKHKIK